MDSDFFDKLEDRISNIGTRECWKRTIGGHTIWFSPVVLEAQAKINETFSNDDLGVAALTEVKRITLSHAIVGIDDIDLRPYRSGEPVFTVPDPRLKKEVKVSLDRYVHSKMGTWGSEFIDQAFEVFADLMVSYRNANLKDVKFENAKDPYEELMEIEARAAELRDQLNLPPLSENEESEELKNEEAAPSSTSAETTFDPFKSVISPTEVSVQQPPAQPMVSTVPATPTSSPLPVTPVHRSVPSAVVPPQSPEIGKESSPDQPFRASDSMGDVIERPASRVHIDPPKIDRVKHQSVNPRFSPPKR